MFLRFIPQSWFSAAKTIQQYTQASRATSTYGATQSSEMCVASDEKGRAVIISSVQQTDGSSTAAAPSVTALTHFAIVWEALLMESEDRKKQHRL